jgi:hypothetical protein
MTLEAQHASETAPEAGVEFPRPWGVHTLEGTGTHRVELGPITFWLRARNGEIWVAHAATPAEGRSDPEPPDVESWVRWAAGGDVRRIRLVPAFPDRPLVVEPEPAFRLLRHAEARVYVRVPLWVRVQLVEPAVTLVEVPTVPLSDTWFGDFIDGELCYWHHTTARREVTPDLFQRHLAMCPIRLSNQADGELKVEKIALRVAHLSLFATPTELWGDEASVRYEGEEAGSVIVMSGKPPREAPEAGLVAPPRVPIQRNFRTRSFARLKALSGLGGGF